MQIGDIIKVIENVRNNKHLKKRATIGEIVAIDSKLTICRIHNNKKTWNISYTVGDLKDQTKEFYIKTNEGWKKLRFDIKEGERCVIQNNGANN